jgi:hypothetical protein
LQCTDAVTGSLLEPSVRMKRDAAPSCASS